MLPQEIVFGVQHHDEASVLELYSLLTATRLKVARVLGFCEARDNIDDLVHDGFLIVLGVIERGELRQPESLPFFIGTIMQRQVAQQIGLQVKRRARGEGWDHDEAGIPFEELLLDPSNPLRDLIDREEVGIGCPMLAMLATMKPFDREILTRFYVMAEPAANICAAMHITPKQFANEKSRAKVRFTDLVRQTLGSAVEPTAPSSQLSIPHCRNGHAFTPANTYVLKGRRSCRKCRSLRRRRLYKAKKIMAEAAPRRRPQEATR
jgi:hypothetical protein